MAQEIYDPLDAYVNVFKDRFRHVAEATFAQLAAIDTTTAQTVINNAQAQQEATQAAAEAEEA